VPHELQDALVRAGVSFGRSMVAWIRARPWIFVVLAALSAVLMAISAVMRDWWIAISLGFTTVALLGTWRETTRRLRDGV
jgi:hypothetical protein